MFKKIVNDERKTKQDLSIHSFMTTAKVKKTFCEKEGMQTRKVLYVWCFWGNMPMLKGLSNCLIHSSHCLNFEQCFIYVYWVLLLVKLAFW